MKIRIESDQYPFEANTTEYNPTSIHAPLGGVIAHVGQALLDLQKSLDELQPDEPGNMYRFSDITALGIVLEWDGVPIGIVEVLDEVPTYVPFLQGGKIQ